MTCGNKLKRQEKENKWVNYFGWNSIDDKWPDEDSEVVIFYISSDDEGTSCFKSEVIHEKFIDAINSPIMYWIKKPE
jgi:hypothetical protein